MEDVLINTAIKVTSFSFSVRKLSHNESLKDCCIHICSQNNFPTAAGLASSAAGYSCLGRKRGILHVNLRTQRFDLLRQETHYTLEFRKAQWDEKVMHNDPTRAQTLTSDVDFSVKTINSWHPNVSTHILHTALYTFSRVLTRRTCFTPRVFSVGDNFLYSFDLNVWVRDGVWRN